MSFNVSTLNMRNLIISSQSALIQANDRQGLNVWTLGTPNGRT